MTTSITLRATKGSALTHDEMDTNLTNLKTTADGAEASAATLTANKAEAAALGVANTDQNMGSFTGTTISDNVSAKAAIQALETALEVVDDNLDDAVLAVGVALGAQNMGTYTGSTITDNQTAKQNIQELETAAELRLPRFADRTALAAVSTTLAAVYDAAYLWESGREGTFIWSAANNSTNVTNDPGQGVYVPPSSDTTGASGAWVRKFDGSFDVSWFGAAPSATGAANSAAWNNAISIVGFLGGGDIWCTTPGTYLLDDTNSGAASWDNRRCIYINQDNIALRLTKGVVLKLANSQDAHVIQIGSRTTTVLTVHNILIEGGEIDGNRANQTTPNTTDDHNQGIAVQSDCTKITIRDIHIHDCMYYNIGFQRTGFIDCLVDNVLLEDCGADGIDMKDDDNDSRGNVCRNVRVRRHGLASATVDPNQAGINPRGGWFISDCEVTEFDGDKHGIRVDLLAAASCSTFQTQIRNCYIEASAVDTTTGVMLNNANADDCVVSDVRVQGCDIGFDSRANRNQLSMLKAVSCDTGFQIYQRQQVVGCSARSCTTGMIVREDENQITNFQALSCTTGINFEAASANNALRGGDFSGNTTNVTDSGTNNAISEVFGVATNAVGSSTFAIDSTGEKTVTVAHGLAFTPLIQNCTPWLERNTSVTDPRYGGVLVYLTDATNVYCKVYVTTASATGGATATLRVRCIAKKATSQ